MRPDDGMLWARVQAGDGEALGYLFERHGNAIYNYCFRRVGEWSTAEDLVSIVFLEAWRHRGQQLPADKVLPWLYGIATNVVRNRRRAERRYAAALSRVREPASVPGFAEEADSRLDDERQMRDVLEVIARLPKSHQEVLVLCGWCGLAYEEAAVALGIPVGTVRSRLSRARRRLRELGFDVDAEEDPVPGLQEVAGR
jgi:RNA polymerase sigma-70 factor (ECF subfamily)